MNKLVLLLLMLLWGAGSSLAQPVSVIFDTDMGNDIDDALALSMLHALESRGESRLLAVTLTKDNAQAGPFVDMVNTFYGRGNIPVGVVREGVTPEHSNYLDVPLKATNDAGSMLFPRDLRDGSDAPEAVALLRRILSEQPDTSVVIVQVGFSTNLARLLDSREEGGRPAGRTLIRNKVKRLVMMAGWFPNGEPEYNVHMDLAAAQKVFEDWPTPIVTSGFEVGNALLYPATSIENDFAWAAHHPVVEAYRAYQQMPYDRPTWDLTAVLYAIRPNHGYFDLTEPGAITVGQDRITVFHPKTSSRHRYLVLKPEQQKRALEALVQLATQPR